jgi:glycosyltransferase involved in cell wall biosynthesis
LKVLYLNHTSMISGAERSLLELLSGLPSTVHARVACPEGDLAEAVRALGYPVSTITGTDASFRFHPLHTSLSVAQIVHAAIRVHREMRRRPIDIVHANSIRAGLIAALTFGRSNSKTLVHVRDCLPRGRAADLVRYLLRSRATLILANSCFTAANFAPNGVESIRPIYTSVDVEAFDPAKIEREGARARLGLEDSTWVLGVVAQLTPWKAQDDAIRVLARLRDDRQDAHLLLAGEVKFAEAATRYDNAAFQRSLHRLADELGVTGNVRFLGEREDVPDIIRALDLLLVPSWEEPFGRSVIEAMAMETPVIATNVGGTAEILQPGKEGLLLPPRSPDLWASEALRLLSDRTLRANMGRKGRETVTARFTRQAHVEAVLSAYRDVLRSQSA